MDIEIWNISSFIFSEFWLLNIPKITYIFVITLVFWHMCVEQLIKFEIFIWRNLIYSWRFNDYFYFTDLFFDFMVEIFKIFENSIISVEASPSRVLI